MGSPGRPSAPGSSSASRATRRSTCRCGRACCAMVAENLTENAIRYAGHGSQFTISVQRAGEFAVMTAADDGAGVSRPRT